MQKARWIIWNLPRPIPSGRDEGQADHTTSRSSWEVPRSREELKRRQQGRKGNRPVDGRPPY